MEMKQLLFFKLTAETEHMTRAAEQLYVAQPFLSRTIASLESELGVKLFDHVGRQIRLNDCGRAFYKHVTNIFAELEDAQSEIKDISLKRNRSVSLVTNTSLYMANVLGDFKRHMPESVFHQASARRFSIIRQLKDGEVDFAICTPAIIDEPELETIVLIEDVCPIIFPPDHWLKYRQNVTLKELEKEPIISAAPGYGIRDLADSFFQAAGVVPNIIVESTDTSVIPNYIKNGLGIGFSPLTSVMQDPLLRENHIVVSAPPCIGVVGLSWKKNRYQSYAAKHFRDFAIRHFNHLNEGVHVISAKD